MFSRCRPQQLQASDRERARWLRAGDRQGGKEREEIEVWKQPLGLRIPPGAERRRSPGCEKSERGHGGNHDGDRGYSGGFGAENCVSERSGNPSGLLKGLELVVGPSAFGADGESNSVPGGLRVENIAKQSFLFRFGEDDAQGLGWIQCFRKL